MVSVGYQLTGQGFVLSAEQRVLLYPDGDYPRHIVRPLVSGRDITQSNRNLFAIDLFGLNDRDVMAQHPALFQWVLDRVKPERDLNNRAALRTRWWIFGEARSTFRPALIGTAKALATSLTSKHRTFVSVTSDTICDSTTVMFALPDNAHAGVLSSVVHVSWATAAGGRLGVGNDPRYNKSRCFDTFPFPDLHADKLGGPLGISLDTPDGTPGPTRSDGESPADRIRALAEQLDAHRKRRQAAHPGLTLTGMYNVLEKLRSGEVLTVKERAIHEHGLVSVLRQLHDELDAAVLAAYGWSDLLPRLRIAHGNDAPTDGQTREDARRAFDDAILERLVALNAERAAEEARGHIRWLRPDFQNPAARAAQPEQGRILAAANEQDAGDDATSVAVALAAPAKPQQWPKDAVEQVRAVADLLAASPVPLSLDDIGQRFTARGPWKKRLPKLLEMLVALGRAQEQDGGFSA